MGALWKVKVLLLDGRHLRLSLRLAHLDAGRFPVSKVFALRLLFDQATDLDLQTGGDVAVGPLGDALTFDELYREAFSDEAASRFIASVEVSQVEHAPFDEDRMRRRLTGEVRALGVAEGTPAWEEAWSERWSAYWKDPANVPSAIYDIRVTGERWLAHLAGIDHWGSAAYSGGPFLPSESDDDGA